jgi:thiol-disulfide isomerase/thioredoxin
MNRIFLLLLLSSLSLFISAYADKREQGFDFSNERNHLRDDTTTIKVDIKDEKKASFYFIDELNNVTPPFFLSGKDRLKMLRISTPTLLIDSYHHIPFLIYPGEQLILKVDPNGLPELSTPINEVRNNELSFYINYFKKYQYNGKSELFIKTNSFLLNGKNYDLTNMIAKAKIDSSNRFAFLNDYKKRFKISSDFYSYNQDLFRALFVADVLTPLTFIKSIGKELPAAYVSYVDSLKSTISCDKCLPNYAYRKSVVAMGKYLTRKYTNPAKKFELSYDKISTSFAGATRRYILFSLLKDNMIVSSTSYEAKLNAYLSEERDNYSVNLIWQHDLNNKYKADAAGKKELTNTNGIKITWNEFLKKYKSYIIYLDFWASWCVPCRESFPFSRQLEADLQGKKIVFVYISIDDNPASWDKAAHEENIKSNENYLLLNAKDSEMMSHFKISAIPRYLIINKESKIIDDNAPAPNNVQLKKMLLVHLTE